MGEHCRRYAVCRRRRLPTVYPQRDCSLRGQLARRFLRRSMRPLLEDEEAAMAAESAELAGAADAANAAPLLGARAELEELPPASPASSLPIAWTNASNAILGAGMYALPRAFAGLGLLGGTALTLSVAALMIASIEIMLRAAERSGHRAWSYAGLIEGSWGRGAGAGLRASIIAIGLGFLVMYLVVVRGRGRRPCRCHLHVHNECCTRRPLTCSCLRALDGWMRRPHCVARCCCCCRSLACRACASPH